jgi:2-succinyl-6-hydroxy-2,4-cyclohexadiene-1-carboxylate synthase
MSARSDRGVAGRLVFLHGFTQTHHHWHPVALAIAARMAAPPTLAFVDLPGHGLSVDDRAALDERGAEQVAAVGGPGTYVGYSMGGRFALFAALARPDLVQRLVLIGATAGIDDAIEREERIRLDDRRADRIEEIGVDAFLDEWLAGPLFATLPCDPVEIEHRARNTPAGLAHSLRTAGTGRQASLWNRLGEIDVPVLVIAGERDDKFSDIGRRMTARLRDARFVQIAGTGHAAHAEAPTATADAIAAWLP